MLIDWVTKREVVSTESTEQIKPTPIRSKPRTRRRVNKDIQRPLPDFPSNGEAGKT